MSGAPADPEAWLAALEGAFEDIANPAMGFPSMEVLTRHRTPPTAYLALLGLSGPEASVQIGLASDQAGCQSLARALLGLTAEEGPLPEAEAADAFCEIVNIAAGAFKARLRGRVTSLQMGLPIYIQGSVHPTEHLSVRVAEVKFGEAKASLLLVYPRRTGQA
jgi:CheY-specific phosphatase CheX